MAHIITGKDEMFGKWVASRIPAIGSHERFGQYKAVGVATGNRPDDKVMAGIVFHDYVPEYATCQISCAAVDPRWASKATIRAILWVPFDQYGCNKVWVAIPHTSERVVQFVKAIGFKQEAVLVSHFGPKLNAVICRMFKTGYEARYWPREKAKAA